MRDSFIVYRSFGKALNALPAENYVNIMKALTAYALDDIEPEGLSEIEAAFFELMRPQVDANNRRYENGHKGGKPKNQTVTKPEPSANQTVTKPEPSVQKPEPNDNDNVNVNENQNVNDDGDGNGVSKLATYAQKTQNAPAPPHFFDKNPGHQTAPPGFTAPPTPEYQPPVPEYWATAPPIASDWEKIRRHWNTKPGVFSCEYIWLNLAPPKRDRVIGVINTYGAEKLCEAMNAHFRDEKAREKGWLSRDLYNFLEKQAERYVEV